MNEKQYRTRLARDLSRWEAAGHVSPAARSAIEADLGPLPAGTSAAAALGFAGAGLLGAGVIALVMANWDDIPRALRLGLILALLAGAIAGAIWTGDRRKGFSGALLLLAALIFAGGVGLVGQMYNLPGEPQEAMALAAVGALGLSWAGSRMAPGALAGAFALSGYGASGPLSWLGAGYTPFNGWDAFALFFLVGLAYTAWRQSSRVLLHIWIWLFASFLFAWLMKAVSGLEDPIETAAFIALLIWGGVAAAGRFKLVPGGPILYGYGGWFAVFALFTLIATLGGGLPGFIAAIVLGVGLSALGRSDQHGWVTGAGVLCAIGGVVGLLTSLGLDLTTAAIVFIILAAVALGVAWRMGKASKPAIPGGAP